MTRSSGGERVPDGEQAPPPYRSGFFLNVVPAMLYVVAIFYGGSAPNPELPEVALFQADKLLHFIAFAGMQMTMLRAVRYELERLAYPRQLLLSAVLSTVVGGALELYQLMLPDRSADVLDLIADGAGAFGAAFVLWLVFGRRYDEPS
jgi:VanZ family protein